MSSRDAQPRAASEAGGDLPGATGRVYTPRFLADWVAERLLERLPENATVADFACGQGVLLKALAECSPRPLSLIGTDVDLSALHKAKSGLPEARFRRLDALAAPEDGPTGLKRRLGSITLDGVILNPPWGIDISAGRSELREGGFKLASGQYDSADLFLEMAVGTLEEGGAAALILPDSLFFPDHAPVRKLLLERCSLDLVARLGEGFFPGVYRGTAILVFRRGTPAPRHSVQCLRLSPDERKAVLSGTTTLARVAVRATHRVPQARFERSPGSNFDIDVRRSDVRHVRLVHRQAPSWTKTLTGGRGVELSKHGEVILCRHCGQARPRPRGPAPVLCECGRRMDPTNTSRSKIVRALRAGTGGAWHPLIAGEDVGRYTSFPRREIRMGIEGINYKAGVDLGRPRLLVRKTGIGLKASIYSGNALTTQTVFHYQPTDESPDFLLAYVLGVLSSRVMLAVHLKRTGEIEWRSHPYVTQKVLAELPIPHPEPGTQQWKQAKAIAESASSFSEDNTSFERDLAIERLVAGLYGFSNADLGWVAQVLNEAQGLKGIASLRLPDGVSMTPAVVD
jgi:adenine-specific DNA-methyltransferase